MKLNGNQQNKAIFLDRDGVINKPIIKDNKPFSPLFFNDFVINENIPNLLEFLKMKGFLLIVITNQPEIKRKNLKYTELNKMHEFIKSNLKVDAIYCCEHDDDDRCACRKPDIGLFKQAQKDFKISQQRSFMIGDRYKDIIAAKSFGCKSILINKNYDETIIPGDYEVNDHKELKNLFMDLV